MIDTILTPTALWKKFVIDNQVASEILKEKTESGILCTSLVLEGRKVKDGIVKIYAELYQKKQASICPAVLLIEDFSINQNKKFIETLVNQGYAVMAVDLAGKSQEEHYTIYPQSIEYANLENTKQALYTVSKDAKSTCWYEWCAVLRYALKYLKELPNITRVGGIALSSVATALWQLAGTDENLDCAILGLNAGWLGYKEIYKYSGKAEPKFSNEMYKFIAGIDSQSYALHIKCPTMILSATNSDEFDIDRAYDTLTKIPTEYYRTIHYSVNSVDRINNQAFVNLTLFLQKYLLDNKKLVLPNESDLKCDVKDGRICAEIDVDEECEIEKVDLYYAEEIINPSLRGWKKVETRKQKDGKYEAEFVPFNQAEIVLLFANIKYSNGFETSTNIVAKRFNEEEVQQTYKSTILYSSREQDGNSIFAPCTASNENPQSIDIVDKGNVKVKKGPMNIEGVTCSAGLRTFILGSKRYMPINGAMFMIDVYSQQASELVIKLVVDYFGNKIEYLYRKNLLGGDVWQNVQVEMNKFKTAEGIVLKDYSKINAIEINVEGSNYLINNALWV